MRRFAAALVLLIAAPILCAHAQSRAIIRGRVVAGDTGDALRNARVAVTASRELPPVLTDGDGRFSLSAPCDGPCTLTLAKPGYARTTLTVRAPADPLTVTMARGAVISGTVMDDRGDPVFGASVIVETVATDGRKPDVLAAPMTDDLGEYRAGDLPAGPVVVSIFAAPGSIRMTIGPGGMTVASGGRGDPQQRVYFPGVAGAASAAVFSLQPGDEKTGVSFVVSVTSTGLGIQAPAYSPRDTTDNNSAVIEGRVLRPGGQPLTGAIVRLIPAGATMAPSKLAVTDVEGRYQFVLPNDAAGTYRVAAAAFNQAYLPTEYGQRRVSDQGEEITVAAGETRDRLVITMVRPGLIAGRVLDENGDPVEGILLHASQVRYVDGRRRLVDMARLAQPTDDLGRYRLTGLPPGEYIVSAAVGQIDMRAPLVDLPGYGITYFPGTPNPSEAQRVLVGRSQDVLGVDFPIARVRTARVSGRAVDSRGDAITGGIALTPSRRSGAVVATQMGAKIERDGRFEFPNVAPGEYVLQASRNRSAVWTEGEASSQFVTVNGTDVTDLEVRTSTGSTLDGHITLEGGGAFSPGQLNVSPVPVDGDLSPLIGGGPAHATMDQDLKFHLAGLTGPRRVRVAHIPPGWTLQAILLNGIDITDTPLQFGKSDQSLADVEVVLSHRVTRITGQVTARGRPAAASILFFPADRQAWYPQSRFLGQTISPADGSFRVEGLPPGEYLVAAVEAIAGIRDGDQWQDPDYLETLVARARRLTLVEGGSTALALTVVER
jgi:protocatechuate 3,4-dioxygenase beta subunit